MRDSIFISYSRKDKKYLDEFLTMLKPMRRGGSVDAWADTCIKPGAQWRDEIKQALNNAKAAVLLVSTHFLDSDFIDKHELPPLLEAAKSDGLTVFWVCLNTCAYEKTEIESYHAFYDPAKVIRRLKPDDRNAVWKSLCQQLEQVAPLPPPGPSGAGVALVGQTIDAKQNTLRIEKPTRAKGGNGSTNCDIEPELRKKAQALIVVILQKSDAATRRLAARFGLDAGPIVECRQRVAGETLNKPLDELFKIALDEQQTLLDEGDEKGANVVVQHVLSILPILHESGDVEGVRTHSLETGKLVELHASHKTIAELIMAKADQRPAAYVRPHKLKEFTGGKACLARVPEGGRDSSGEQFQRDFTEDLACTFESAIDAQFEHKFSGYLRKKFTDIKDDKDLDIWINEGLRLYADHQARQFRAVGSGFTYYFLVETPPGLTDAERDAQNAFLLRLKARFPAIAFLRLAPLSEEELLPYSQLRALLYANPEID